MARLSIKTKQKLQTYFRIVLLFVFCVLFIPPFRNFVLSPFLPGSWLPFNTFRILQMVMDKQNFPIKSPFVLRQPGFVPSLEVNMSDMNSFIYKDDPYKDFPIRVKELKVRARTDSAAKEELAIVENFAPVMSAKDRANLFFTLHVFQKACEKYKLDFFIFEGALLGSYRHHGLIPWDDDIDIAMNASQWREIHHVLNNIPGFTLFAPPDSQWKFYLSDLPPFQNKLFKFPYLDLFFYREHGPYVWGITWGMKNHLMLETKHLFPLRKVQWEMFSLPAPACVQQMTEYNYGVGMCMTPKYNHKTNEVKYGFQTDKVDCSRLYNYLPFVFRHAVDEGRRIVESRRVGGRVIHNVTVLPPSDVCFED